MNKRKNAESTFTTRPPSTRSRREKAAPGKKGCLGRAVGCLGILFVLLVLAGAVFMIQTAQVMTQSHAERQANQVAVNATEGAIGTFVADISWLQLAATGKYHVGFFGRTMLGRPISEFTAAAVAQHWTTADKGAAGVVLSRTATNGESALTLTVRHDAAGRVTSVEWHGEPGGQFVNATLFGKLLDGKPAEWYGITVVHKAGNEQAIEGLIFSSAS